MKKKLKDIVVQKNYIAKSTLLEVLILEKKLKDEKAKVKNWRSES